MNNRVSDYQEVMLNEFSYRKGSNPAYSMRSFARDLNLSPSRLSEVLTRKGHLSPEKASDIAIKLGLRNKEVGLFKAMVIIKSKISNEKEKKLAEDFITETQHSDMFRILDEATFGLIAEPEHLEILMAMELLGFDGTPEWLGENLNLDVTHVVLCLDRLLKAGLISKSVSHYHPRKEYIATSQDIPSKALRLSHKQTLRKAINSLDEVPVEFRDITSITMPIDIEKLSEAKQLIKDFRRNMNLLLTEGQKKSHVYNLNIQLYPISKVES